MLIIFVSLLSWQPYLRLAKTALFEVIFPVWLKTLLLVAKIPNKACTYIRDRGVKPTFHMTLYMYNSVMFNRCWSYWSVPRDRRRGDNRDVRWYRWNLETDGEHLFFTTETSMHIFISFLAKWLCNLSNYPIIHALNSPGLIRLHSLNLIKTVFILLYLHIQTHTTAFYHWILITVCTEVCTKNVFRFV